MGKKRFGIGALVAVFMLSMSLFAGGTYYLVKTYVGNPASLVQVIRTMHLIGQHYVGDEVSENKLYDGALKGMVNMLGDPYSAYLDAEDFKALSTVTEGHFGGVGMVMGMKDGNFVIVSPIEDTPAYKAGIKAGDILLKINDEELKGQTLDVVVKKIRGEDGTQVKLLIQRGNDAPQEFTITRSDIKIKSVYGRMLQDQVGYVRITNFSEDTAKDFKAKLEELEGKGMKGLVLDLRDNPGGLLNSGVNVARLLVPQGPIVSITDKQGQTMTETSSLEKVKYPLAVLVNHGTASASEIVSGAIQDTGSGRLFGVKTFGKGVVQSVFMLTPNTAVKLTIAKYYTPSGRSIHKVGITPDEVVEPADEAGTNQLDAAEAYVAQQLQ